MVVERWRLRQRGQGENPNDAEQMTQNRCVRPGGDCYDQGKASGRISMLRLIAGAALAIAAACGVAQAQQAYPARTVRLILPFGAASATDTTARLLAAR